MHLRFVPVLLLLAYARAIDRKCSAHSDCSNLEENCCPADDGKNLDCCPRSDPPVPENPQCNLNSACTSLTGLCCPSSDGVFLDCCYQSPTFQPAPTRMPTRMPTTVIEPALTGKPTQAPTFSRGNCSKKGKKCKASPQCCKGLACLGNKKGKKLRCKKCRKYLQSCKLTADCCAATVCAIEGICVQASDGLPP
jgi:hypothetical protein